MNIKDITEGVLGFFLVIFAAYKGLSSIISFDKFKKDNKRCDLTQHPFFFAIEEAMNYKIDKLVVEGAPQKTKILHMYLQTKSQEYYKSLKDVVIKFQQNPKGFSISEEAVLSIFDKTVAEYRKQAVQKITEKYNAKVAYIFDDTFTNKFHIQAIINTRSAVSLVCRSSFYDSIIDRICAILDISSYAFQHTLLDAEKTVMYLNGSLSKELKKLGYEDETCGAIKKRGE